MMRLWSGFLAMNRMLREGQNPEWRDTPTMWEGIFSHETNMPRGEPWRLEDEPINLTDSLPRPRGYYAAQGNATRLFFRKEIPGWPERWKVFHAEGFSCVHYLLSGGYSKPAFYPVAWLDHFYRLEAKLSRRPRVFGGRCLIGLSSE